MSAAATETLLSTILPISSDAIEKIAKTHPTICRYFLRGNCRFGALCHFSHDLSAIDDATLLTTNNNNNKLDEDVKPSTSRTVSTQRNWVNAPVFVPQCRHATLDVEEVEEGATALPMGSLTYADVVGHGNGLTTSMQCMSLNLQLNSDGNYGPSPHLANQLCPYMPPCPYMHNCAFGLHMELCEMCDQYVLDPTDAEQRRKHNQECLEQHEKDMELSFAIARSKDKTCGICFETIIEKSGREKRFGILPNCNHIFCLECIRKWRQAKQFEHKIIRSCPECRVASDFVCPSAFWVDTKEDKTKLLDDYRKALGAKDCKYFKKGEGTCPFANKCFYKHALPNGELVDVGKPKRPRIAQRNSNELVDLLDIYLWEFVAQRGDFNLIDLLSHTSDETDDDTDWYDDDDNSNNLN